MNPPVDATALRSSQNWEAHLDRLVNRFLPRVLARLDDGSPLVVARRIGRGQVVFLGTSLDATDNTWSTTNAVLFWHSIVDDLLRDTLPLRDHAPSRQIAVELAQLAPSESGNMRWQLHRPFHTFREGTASQRDLLSASEDQQAEQGGQRGLPTKNDSGDDSGEDVSLSLMRSGGWGVECRNVWRRGVYRLEPQSEGVDPIRFSITPPSGLQGESNVHRASESELATTLAETGTGDWMVRQQPDDDWTWWYLILIVMGLLFSELALLNRRRSSTPPSEAVGFAFGRASSGKGKGDRLADHRLSDLHTEGGGG